MSKFLFFFISIVTCSLQAQIYPCYNISLLGIVDPETTVNWLGAGTKYSGCYGWYNPADNREYAILGSTKGNHFIEVTDPANPVVRDYVPGYTQNSLTREIKTYHEYAYLVSDDGGSKFQIVDMSYLPDSVHVVYTSVNLFTRSHTLFIEGNKLYCGGVTRSGALGNYSMAVYSLADPANPVLLRALNEDYPSVGYVHDMFVKNDTVYASTGSPGLFIFKYDSIANTFSMLASYSNYLQSGYNHSSYITPDSKTLVFCDEGPPGLAAKVLDVSDLGNLDLSDTIVSHPGATPHNPYIMDNYHVVMSYYQDGVYVYDVSDPSNAVLKGFFDTDPAHGDNDNYSTDPWMGCWGAYPYLPSGILLASDMQNGLFILNINAAVGLKKTTQENFIRLFPNPSGDLLNFVVSNEEKGVLQMVIYDIAGKKIKETEINKTENVMNFGMDISDIAAGSYVIKLSGVIQSYSTKLVITK
jgi:choice-of-anchor B domain-containing protein